eukprot:jgi/Chlat1/5330/Chrsp35S05202
MSVAVSAAVAVAGSTAASSWWWWSAPSPSPSSSCRKATCSSSWSSSRTSVSRSKLSSSCGAPAHAWAQQCPPRRRRRRQEVGVRCAHGRDGDGEGSSKQAEENEDEQPGTTATSEEQQQKVDVSINEELLKRFNKSDESSKEQQEQQAAVHELVTYLRAQADEDNLPADHPVYQFVENAEKMAAAQDVFDKAEEAVDELAKRKILSEFASYIGDIVIVCGIAAVLGADLLGQLHWRGPQDLASAAVWSILPVSIAALKYYDPVVDAIPDLMQERVRVRESARGLMVALYGPVTLTVASLLRAMGSELMYRFFFQGIVAEAICRWFDGLLPVTAVRWFQLFGWTPSISQQAVLVWVLLGLIISPFDGGIQIGQERVTKVEVMVKKETGEMIIKPVKYSIVHVQRYLLHFIYGVEWISTGTLVAPILTHAVALLTENLLAQREAESLLREELREEAESLLSDR